MVLLQRCFADVTLCFKWLPYFCITDTRCVVQNVLSLLKVDAHKGSFVVSPHIQQSHGKNKWQERWATVIYLSSASTTSKTWEEGWGRVWENINLTLFTSDSNWTIQLGMRLDSFPSPLFGSKGRSLHSLTAPQTIQSHTHTVQTLQVTIVCGTHWSPKVNYEDALPLQTPHLFNIQVNNW